MQNKELKFGLIGDGYIAKMHRNAVSSLGLSIDKVYDPKYPSSSMQDFFSGLDYVIICSPSNTHYEYTKAAISHDIKVICEKPLVCPWQPIIDDDRINVVLQYRWADLPDKIDTIEVCMVRNKEYFQSWKGDALQTGGLFFNLFIHYVDLALKYKAKFVGRITESGSNIRRADDVDLFKFDMQTLYNKMYHDIIYNDKGIKPKDIMYLNWFLNTQSHLYGFGESALEKEIIINRYLA